MQTAALPLSWPELAAGFAGLLVVANATRRGFLREGSLLLGLGVAIWLAGALYHPLGTLLLPRAARDGPWAVALFGSLALTLLIAVAGLSALAAPLVRRGALRGLDRAAGLLVGLGECALVLGILALAGDRLGLFRPPVGSPLARAGELVATALARVVAALPPEVFGALQPR